MLHHLAVVGLVKEESQAFGDNGAHVIDLQELLFRGVHDGVEVAKVPRQFFGCGLAHMANAQSEHKSGQSGLLGFL